MKSFKEFCDQYEHCDECKIFCICRNLTCEKLYNEAAKNSGRIVIDISEEMGDEE